MALSDQLSELAARSNEAEEHTAAAREKSKANTRAPVVETARASAQARARSCASRPRRTRTSSRSGGMTCSAHGTSTWQRFATTSMPSGPSTTWIAPSAARRRELTTRRSRSSSHTPRSRRRSTPCSTPNWQGWRRTSAPPPEQAWMAPGPTSSSGRRRWCCPRRPIMTLPPRFELCAKSGNASIRHGDPCCSSIPRSGDGKAAHAALAERARKRGVEPVVFGPGDDLATLIANAVNSGADALGMAGGDGWRAARRRRGGRARPAVYLPSGRYAKPFCARRGNRPP